MSALVVGEVAVVAVIGGSIAGSWLVVAGREARHEKGLLREHARAHRAHLAAVEAAEVNPIFSPDAIEQSVREVVALANDIWRGKRPPALGDRPDGALIRSWARSRESWLGERLRVAKKPSVDVLRVVNRGTEDEDRVVVRMHVWVSCGFPLGLFFHTRHVPLDERWTFGRFNRRWALLSVTGDPLSGPVLSAPLVPNPSFDTARLNEESLSELADAQKVGDGVDLSELVSPDEPPALALPDLAVVDGRFAPELIGAELAHLLEVWEEAVTGSEAPLEALTSASARTALLYPDRGTRLILRDSVLKSWKPTKLDLSRRPPAIEVALEVDAIRYVVTSGGSYRGGDNTGMKRMNLTWTLELTDATKSRWRLTDCNNPAAAIPDWNE